MKSVLVFWIPLCILILFFEYGGSTSGNIAGIGTLFFFVAWVSLTYVISLGISARNIRYGVLGWRDTVDEHHFYVKLLTYFLVFGVVAIEMAVRKEGGLWGPLWLLVVHLSFVTCAVLSFVLARVFFTGITNPRRHRSLVYTFTVFFHLTLVTGTVLVLERFPLR